MRNILIVFVVLLSGCSGIEKMSTLEKGINVSTAPKTIDIQKPIIQIEPNAVNVAQPLVKVDPINFNQTTPLVAPNAVVVDVQPKAVCVEIQKDSFFHIESGAITINASLGQKPPPLEKPELKGVRPLKYGDLSKVVIDPKILEDIVNNETVYKSFVEALLKQIQAYNDKYSYKEEDTKPKTDK